MKHPESHTLLGGRPAVLSRRANQRDIGVMREYSHALGCSVTGGYVYRGQLFPAMTGIYFYGDFCSGRIWGLSFDGTAWQNTEYLDSALFVSSFGEDVNGEVYVVDLNGGVYRLQGTGTTPTPSVTPTRTSTPTP